MGYSLDRSSVPLCEGVDESAERTCFMRQRKKFIWENRDFNVPSKAVLDYIRNVVLSGRKKERTCREMQKQLPPKFVLYNVWCSEVNHWHLRSSNGEKACVYGTGYQNRTIEKTEDSRRFNTKGKCCTAFPEACREASESKEEESDSSPSKMVLFHDYHKFSSSDEAASQAELAAFLKLKDKERKKRQARKKERKAQNDVNKNNRMSSTEKREKKKRQARKKEQKAQNDISKSDGRSSVENNIMPIDNDRDGFSQEVASSTALLSKSKEKKEERNARKRKQYREKPKKRRS